MALRRIRYVGPLRPGVVIENPPGRWVEVPYNGTVDLPTSLADSFAEQADNWQVVDTRRAAKNDDGEAAPAADVEGDG